MSYFGQQGKTFPQSLVTSYQSLVTSHQLLVASHQLLVTSHYLRVSNYQLLAEVTSYQLVVDTSHQFLVDTVSSQNDIVNLVRTILSRKFKKNVSWCTLFTHFNGSLKTNKILSLLLIRWICLNSPVLEAATKRPSAKKMLLKLSYKSICETLVKLVWVYKDELLLRYFRRKYLYLLLATFVISKQLVSPLKLYS